MVIHICTSGAVSPILVGMVTTLFAPLVLSAHLNGIGYMPANIGAVASIWWLLDTCCTLVLLPIWWHWIHVAQRYCLPVWWQCDTHISTCTANADCHSVARRMHAPSVAFFYGDR